MNVGVMDGAEFSAPDTGTVQGSTLSPSLGNVYLHYVLDRWFAEEVKPRLRGKAKLVHRNLGVFCPLAKSRYGTLNSKRS
jgi:hypothetical protein